MREEDSNWFTRWEEELPSPEELTPLTQTLITPDLALAFNISPHAPPPPPHAPHHSLQVHHHNHAPSSEFDSAELSSGGGGGGSAAAGDEPARTLKRPRLVWTPQLHKRFVDAVAHLGIKNAVPKTIMQLMSVDGLTRENVASHLQKYRLYLKRMQGISGGGGGGAASSAGADPATDRLFASGPVPAHFLHPAAFVPVTASSHHHHGPGVVVRPVHQSFGGHFGNSPPNGGGGFEGPFLRQQQRMGMPLNNGGGGYGEDLDSGNGPKVLTLFPTE